MSFVTKGVSAPSFTLARLAQAVSVALLLSAGAAQAAPAPTLFSSATAISGDASGKRLIQVVPDRAALLAAKRGQSLQLDLPGLGKHEVVFDGSLQQGDATKWMGHLKEGVQYSVILTLAPQGISGDLRTPKGLFELGNANGQHWIVNKGLSGSSSDLAKLPGMFRDTPQAANSTGRKPAKVAWPVNFDLPRMSALKPGAEVTINIPGRGSYDVVYDNTLATDRGAMTWVGHLKDYGSDFRVLVTSGPEGSLGHILTPSGELELTMVGNQQWLVDRQASGQTNLVPDHTDAHAPPVDGLMKAATATAAAKGLSVQAAAGSTSTGGTTTTTTTTATATPATVIDVMILYTPGFVTARGTSWRLRLDQLVALANQAYIDSGINIRIRLVLAKQVAIADNTSNATTLGLLLNNTASAGFGTVGTDRLNSGADLVTLIRPFMMVAQGGNCGAGYVLGTPANSISLYYPYAYSIVSDGTDGSYYCADYSFAHELGHNMGSMHDRATVAAQGGQSVGAYAYGYGYGTSGSFGTVMSYINPRIGKFSNPNDLTCGGNKACGISEVGNTTTSANNALSINNTATKVAAFMATRVADTQTISGVVSKAGVAQAGVSFTPAPSTAATCTTSAANGTYACTVPLNWSGTVTPVLTGATFTPASLSYSGVLSSQTNQNFTKN